MVFRCLLSGAWRRSAPTSAPSAPPAVKHLVKHLVLLQGFDLPFSRATADHKIEWDRSVKHSIIPGGHHAWGQTPVNLGQLRALLVLRFLLPTMRVTFSSPWPLPLPWQAAPEYPPPPRAATASCSQPRFWKAGRGGQGSRRQPSLHPSSQCELWPGGAEGAGLGQSTGPQGNPAPW